MYLNLVFWIIFGALAGWVAAIFTGNGERSRSLRFFVVIGIAGAVMGNLILEVALKINFSFLLDSGSLATSIVGAFLALSIAWLLNNKKPKLDR